MIVILLSVSSSNYNDDIVEGFVHFTLSTLVNGQEPIYAVFRLEEEYLELIQSEKVIKVIVPQAGQPYSSRSECVRQLASQMTVHDEIKALSLSEFGDNAEEAKYAYYLFLRKGISISFYETSYLNSEVLDIRQDPSEEQKKLIDRQIENHFENRGNRPVLSKTELTKIAGMTLAKKK